MKLKNVKDWDAIENFLTAHGQHYYYGYKDCYNDLNQDKTYTDDEAGARELSRDLMAVLNNKLDVNRQAQDSVQKKLIEICELIRVGRAGGGPLFGPPTATWYGDVVMNGLCFGFTEIFKGHTDWEMALWEAIVAWRPIAGDTATCLAALNEYLDRAVNWSDGLKANRALEGALMLKEAWEYMNLESTDYGFAPAWLDLVGTAAATTLVDKGEVTKNIITLGDARIFIGSVGNLVELDALKTGGSAYILEISTPNHSMMARFNNGVIDALESEENGIDVVTNWNALADFLWDGIQIGYTQGDTIPLNIDVKRLAPNGTDTSDGKIDMTGI